jgi:hypothetical protein
MKPARVVAVAISTAMLTMVVALATPLADATENPTGLERANGEMGRRSDDTGSPEVFAPDLDRAIRQSGIQEPQGMPRDSTPAAVLEVNLVFHVLSGPLSEGDLGDDIIVEQMAVLNDAYQPAGFHFNLAEVLRYPDSPYFSDGCFPTTELGIRMKMELAIDPTRYVNIYSCRLALPYIAGYGTLPNEFPESDPRHGVVIDYGTVPGSAPPLSLGHTLVHELGHYFGLLHTFQGGCGQPDDDVSDTPAEAVPGYGCLLGRDSCPQEGLDPVTNFMDYSDDTCTDNFTPLQGARMQTLVAVYRPGLAPPVATAPSHRIDLRRFDLIFGR